MEADYLKISRMLSLRSSSMNTYSGLMNDELKEIEIYTKLLPSWVDPSMVYPWRKITKTKLLGSGEYGTVYKGTYSHGTAV